MASIGLCNKLLLLLLTHKMTREEYAVLPAI